MPLLSARLNQDGSPQLSRWGLNLALFASSLVAYIWTATQHSLLTSALAWTSICIYTFLKCGGKTGLSGTNSAQKISWAAGSLLALAQVCERAADGRGIWWAKALTVFAVYTSSRTGLIGRDSDSGPDSRPSSPEKVISSVVTDGSKTTLTIMVVSAIAALFASAGSNTSIALGLSYAIVCALAILLVERAYSEAQRSRVSSGSVIYSANGLLSQPVGAADGQSNALIMLVRDISAATAFCTIAATLTMESFHFGGIAYPGIIGPVLGGQWTMWQSVLRLLFGTAIVLVHVIMDGSLLTTILAQGSFTTSLVPLFSAIGAQLFWSFSLSRLWFAVLSAASAFLFLDETEMLSVSGRTMRVSKLFRLVSVISFLGLVFYYLRQPYAHQGVVIYPVAGNTDELGFTIAPQPLAPLQVTDKKTHPLSQLVRTAQAEWNTKLHGQSKSLEDAVTEYKKRYGMHPPPNFNKWYEFARAKGVPLIDEYDTIYHSLLPFWALSPATIRARTREALGFGPNNLIGLLLRDGKAVHVEGGEEWQQQATIGMMEQFIQYLPDMDLAFNIHDEPRVVVPSEELARLVDIALNQQIPKASKQTSPKNTWSSRPKDLGKGRRIEEFKTTRFNVFAHQPTWIPSRLSCPIDTPARAVDWTSAQDNLTAYAFSDLGFVYNHTAFSDICNSPSFATSHGFFERPNAFNVVHDLVPIFSQSKMSSFQDIVYPSPWYWYGKVSYDAKKDMDWSEKESRLWWRGSTTGGFSRDGGWRRQHRQTFVREVNALDQAKIMKNIHADDPNANPEWTSQEIPRRDMKDIMDVHFSHIGQCDPGDCDAQREFFTVVDPADQQEAWKFKYLLDIDGNAFSGRFYAFLKSKSLTFKMAVFREWHEEWIKPWVHYIPLSLRADDTLEAVRYFSAEDEGKSHAIQIAEASQQWANTALKNEDFEAWFFRLLLEYGRLIDDNREVIGYTGS